MNKNLDLYDLIIIGAGPAGLGAGIYAARYALDFVIIGSPLKSLLTSAESVENYLGIKKMSGIDLINRSKKHILSLGAKIIEEEVKGIQKTKGGFGVFWDNQTYKTKVLLLALGTQKRGLNVPGEEKFIGRGVSYCATCDGMFFKGKVVVVVGGSDSALSTALYLSKIVKKVYLIYRGKQFRAEPIWVKKVKETQNIEVITNTNITEIKGGDVLGAVVLDNPYQKQKELKLDGIFMEIGSTPNIFLTKELGVSLDNQGYIVVDSAQKTNVKGVWAAGDVTTGSNKLRQIIAAAAEGAIAVNDIFNYLKKK